jgi:hypothetical protein
MGEGGVLRGAKAESIATDAENPAISQESAPSTRRRQEGIRTPNKRKQKRGKAPNRVKNR